MKDYLKEVASVELNQIRLTEIAKRSSVILSSSEEDLFESSLRSEHCTVRLLMTLFSSSSFVTCVLIISFNFENISLAEFIFS